MLYLPQIGSQGDYFAVIPPSVGVLYQNTLISFRQNINYSVSMIFLLEKLYVEVFNVRVWRQKFQKEILYS